MARPARLSPDGILDTAAVVASQRWRDATVADVAARLGTAPNAVSYRFPTKDALFGSLWLRAIRRFHVGLLEALAHDDPGTAAADAAAHIPAFCRAHPLDAVAMTLYRQQDLAGRVSGDLRAEVLAVNEHVVAAMLDLVRRRFGRDDTATLHLTAVACQEGPYGLVRRYLRDDTPMPPWLEDVARASCAATLALGDEPGWEAGHVRPASADASPT